LLVSLSQIRYTGLNFEELAAFELIVELSGKLTMRLIKYDDPKGRAAALPVYGSEDQQKNKRECNGEENGNLITEISSDSNLGKYNNGI